MRQVFVISSLLFYGCEDDTSGKDLGFVYPERVPAFDHFGMQGFGNDGYNRQSFAGGGGDFKVQSGRVMRERVFPVTDKFATNEHIKCPPTKPASWTDLWYSTCAEIVRDRSAIHKKDMSIKTTKFPSKGKFSEFLNDKADRSYGLYTIRDGFSVSVLRGSLKYDSDSVSPKSAIFKYQLNCDNIYLNKECESQMTTGTVTPRCSRQWDEDPLLTEYVFSRVITNHFGKSTNKICPRVFSLSPPVEIEQNLPKIDFGIMHKYGSFCRQLNSSFRVIVEEEIGSTTDKCWGESAPENRSDVAKFAIGAFIQTIKLLRDIHSIGILHGDIHSGNIAFRSPSLGCDFHHPENLILIDFGLAEFFPADLGKPILTAPGAYDALNPVLITQFELLGYRRGRRDDIYRALQELISALSGGKLLKLYHLISQKRVFTHEKFAQMKSALLWSTDVVNQQRTSEMFPDLQVMDSIANAINKYSGISWISKVFSTNWNKARQILNNLEIYVKGRDTDRPLPSPETEPHYDWVIEQATNLLTLIN